MKRYALILALPVAVAAGWLLLGSERPAIAHCEVPCGIFDDPARFTALLEDQSTIAKAVDQIGHAVGEKMDALAFNQTVRWVHTKEDHATKVMDTIGQYFMAQRIKPGPDGDAAGAKRYTDQLTAAHRVMLVAMKTKQTVDPAAANALKDAIQAFKTAYEAK